MATKDATGVEIVPLDDAAVEQALRGELASEQIEKIAIEDPREVQLDIIKRILASPDADTILGGQTALGGREVLERPFTLSGVRWHKSSIEGGILPVFAVLDATFLDDGASAVITTGAGSVMAQAYALKKGGNLPINVKIVEGDPTAAGFRPQWLQRA